MPHRISILPLLFVRFSKSIFIAVLHLSPSRWLLDSHDIDPFLDMTIIGIVGLSHTPAVRIPFRMKLCNKKRNYGKNINVPCLSRPRLRSDRLSNNSLADKEITHISGHLAFGIHALLDGFEEWLLGKTAL
jgi:hypothetical protein